MNQKRGKLFVLSGPSGAGKGTICKRLIAETELELSISATTRQPRPGETDGVSYFFLDRETFEARTRENGFLEYAQVYGNYYGTPRQAVLERLEAGIDVILEIDIQGAMKVRQTYPDGIFLFVLPPSLAILRQRLEGRQTDSQETIEKRLAETMNEIRQVGGYDYCIVNDQLDEAVARCLTIIEAEHLRVPVDAQEIIRKYEEE